MIRRINWALTIILLLTPILYATLMFSSGIDPLVTHTESIGYRYFGAERWFLGVPNIFLQGETSSILRLFTFLLGDVTSLDIKTRILVSSYTYGLSVILIVTLLMYKFYRKSNYKIVFQIFIIWSATEIMNPTIMKYDYHTYLSTFCVLTLVILHECKGKFKLNYDVLLLGAFSACIIIEKITYIALIIIFILNFNKKIKYQIMDLIKFSISFAFTCAMVLMISYDFQIGVVKEKITLMRTWIDGSFQYDMNELYFVFGIIILVNIIFVMRVINNKLLTSFGNFGTIFLPIIVYLMRPTNDTRSETIIILITIVFVIFQSYGYLDESVNRYFHILIYFLLPIYFILGYQKIELWRESSIANTLERGKIVWEIYNEIITSREKTLLIYPNDSWNAGNFGEALLKGYSATPTWYVRTREREKMILLYPNFHHFYQKAMYTEPERIELQSFNQFYYTSHKGLGETLKSVDGIENVNLSLFRCKEWVDQNTDVIYRMCGNSKTRIGKDLSNFRFANSYD
jgi:hypothetical protein